MDARSFDFEDECPPEKPKKDLQAELDDVMKRAEASRLVVVDPRDG